MNKDLVLRPHKADRTETVLYTVLGLLGLVCIGLTLVSSSDFLLKKDQVIAKYTGKANGQGYFNSWQWQADRETWAAMLRYLMESDDSPLTNIGPSEASAAGSVRATNTSTRVPKV
jgi:hypothetical protein